MKPMKVTPFILFALLAGCAGGTPASDPATAASANIPSAIASPTSTPSAPSPPAGMGSASMTLPANWTEIEMTEAALRNYLEVAGDANPEFVAVLQGLLASASYDQYAFWAMGYGDGVYIGNVNITQSPAEGLSLDGAEPMLLAQMNQIPGYSDVNSSRADLPIGEALLITAMATTSSGQADSDIVQAQRGYFLIQNDVFYGVVFSCAQGNDTCLTDAEAMVKTLVIAP
jgi:hypothetical protein